MNHKILEIFTKRKKEFSGIRDFDFIEKRISKKLTKIIYEIDYDELKYEKQENICNDALSLYACYSN